jgi:hypothetical protein
MAEFPVSSLKAVLGVRLKLTLHAHGAVLLRSGLAHGLRGGWQKVGQVSWQQDPSLDAVRLVEHCASLFENARAAGLPLTVVVGASQARLFVVTPPRNAARLADLRAAAALRFCALYGDPLDAWAMAFDARVDAPFVASALPRQRLSALQALAAAQRIPLVRLEPRFAVAWNQMRSRLDGAWLAVVDDGLLALAVTACEPRQSLLGIHMVRLPEHGADRRWLREQVGRVALREGVSPPLRVIGWRERPGEEPPTSVIEMPRLQLVCDEDATSLVQRSAAG